MFCKAKFGSKLTVYKVYQQTSKVPSSGFVVGIAFLFYSFFKMFILHAGKIMHAFMSSADFLYFFFSKILSGMSNSLDPEMHNILSCLIWVQTVCKGFQQTTLAV